MPALSVSVKTRLKRRARRALWEGSRWDRELASELGGVERFSEPKPRMLVEVLYQRSFEEKSRP